VAIRYLEENNIEYVRELKVDRYFVDLAFPDKMLAIEIDGQQHNLPERREADSVKDKILTSFGWQVVRIKWPTENIRLRLSEIFI